MATVSAFSTPPSIFCRYEIPSHSLTLTARNLHFQSHGVANSFTPLTLLNNRIRKESKTSSFCGIRRLRSVGEETQLPEEETEQQEAQVQEQEQQTVFVPVSPSDTLTMHFQAEGTMNETAIPVARAALKNVIFMMKAENKRLFIYFDKYPWHSFCSQTQLKMSRRQFDQEVEGITDLKVQVLEGIASVELIKQTTVQATGVASSLVEVIQGSGFKLQTLNLSFEDEEDLVAQ